VAVTCIDGRIQDAVREQLRARCGVQFVDTVTLPGPDSALAAGLGGLEATVDAIDVSLTAHDSGCVVVVGHTDCAANPVDDATHHDQVERAVRHLRASRPDVVVKGLLLHTGTATVTVVDDGATPRPALPEETTR
jgi:hypothetical protein